MKWGRLGVLAGRETEFIRSTEPGGPKQITRTDEDGDYIQYTHSSSTLMHISCPVSFPTGERSDVWACSTPSDWLLLCSAIVLFRRSFLRRARCRRKWHTAVWKKGTSDCSLHLWNGVAKEEKKLCVRMRHVRFVRTSFFGKSDSPIVPTYYTLRARIMWDKVSDSAEGISNMRLQSSSAHININTS